MEDAWIFQGRQYQPGAASQLLAELGAPRLSHSLPLASLLLIFCIFTTTFTSKISSLRYLRLLLTLPCCALWLAVSFPPGIPPGQDLGVYTVLATLGVYGVMKTIDICIVGYWDTEDDVPRWVAVREVDDKKHDNTTTPSGFTKTVQPLPSTLRGRIAYALDAFFSIRGASCFTDYAWNWAPKEIWTYRPPPSKVHFIKLQLLTIAYGIIALDITDAIFAARQWDTNSPNALTGHGSTLAQMVYSGSEGLFMYFCGFLPFDFLSIIIVPLTGMHPQGWPPFWGPPLQTSSIADFWARRWHILFRRVFVRLSLPVKWVIQPYANETVIRTCRMIVGFILSTILHLVVPLGIPRDGNHYLVLVQWGTIKFFLSQPLGIMVESHLIIPLTERWPHRAKIVTRRAFTWGWIVWTARWNMDGYVPDGQFDRKQASPFGLTTKLVGRLGLYR